MSKDLTAICPNCDNIIEVEEGVQEGDHISCPNFPCFFEGVVEDIDEDGNVDFENEEEDKE